MDRAKVYVAIIAFANFDNISYLNVLLGRLKPLDQVKISFSIVRPASSQQF